MLVKIFSNLQFNLFRQLISIENLWKCLILASDVGGGHGGEVLLLRNVLEWLEFGYHRLRNTKLYVVNWTLVSYEV